MRMVTEQSIYQWPHYYDWTSEGLDYDVTYYVELAKLFGGPVLELGCGTGRVSLAIAREGVEVVGLDYEPLMLNEARAKTKAMGLTSYITWVHGDMSNFQLERKFPLIIIPYRSFQHLSTAEMQANALRSISRHLCDDGRLALNLFVPLIAQLHELEGAYSYRGQFPVPGTNEQVEVFDATEMDHFNQIIRVTRYYERFSQTGESLERLRTHMKIRYTFPQELEHLLNRYGFGVEARYGDFIQGCFGTESTELIIEATKKGI